MTQYKTTCFVLVAAFAFFGSCLAQDRILTEKTVSQIQTRLDEFISDENYPGGTLAIALGDQKVVTFASGMQHIENKMPMETDSIMFVGSTGKTFVSAIALQLVQEEKIDLDRKLTAYLSEDKEEWIASLPNIDGITIRNLMNHTSGLPRYIFQPGFMAELKANPMAQRSPQECLAHLADLDPVHDVGSGWAYSDSNYLLLGLVIEKVTGKDFYDLAKARLLEPLQLTNTTPTTQARLPGLVNGYIGSANPFGLPKETVKDGSYAINPSFEWCGGGFVSNVADLANWLRALHTSEVLNEDTYKLLIQPVDFRTGQPSEAGYGLGTFVWKTKLGKAFGHAGVMPGYLTQIEHYPDHDITIAFQVNTDQGFGQKHHGFVVELAEIVTAIND